MADLGPESQYVAHKVSVIVPNYNHARFLRRRIESVLNQDFQDFELILLDDCSTDDESVAILHEYARHPKVSHLVVNEVNSGSPFTQWNRGVDLASGELVWIAEADDDADTSLLSSLVEILLRNSKVTLAYCQSMVVDEDDAEIGVHAQAIDAFPEGPWKADFVMDGRKFFHEFQYLYNVVPNASAVVFRRKAFLDAGMSDVSYRYCGDWILWARLMLAGDIGFCAEPRNRFRKHAGTVRASSAVDGRILTERVRIWHELHEADVPFSGEMNQRIADYLGPRLQRFSSIGFTERLKLLRSLIQLQLLFYVPAKNLLRFIAGR